jgi:hypothetical protein
MAGYPPCDQLANSARRKRRLRQTASFNAAQGEGFSRASPKFSEAFCALEMENSDCGATCGDALGSTRSVGRPHGRRCRVRASSRRRARRNGRRPSDGAARGWQGEAQVHAKFPSSGTRTYRNDRSARRKRNYADPAVVATAEWDAWELARPKSAFSFTHAVKARGIDGWTAQQWGAQHLWLAQ